MHELQAIVSHLTAHPARACALATLVNVEGSSYRRTGARLLLDDEGTRLGSISGGCLENDIVEHARSVLNTGAAKLVVYDTTEENDLIWGVGTGCHGVVQVLIERLPESPVWVQTVRDNFSTRRKTGLSTVWQSDDPAALGTYLTAAAPTAVRVFQNTVLPPVKLMIFGAGDDAVPLARLAGELGWEVHVRDPRAALATAARFPTASQVSGLVPADAAHLPLDAQTVAVIMTHHYVHDVPLVQALLPREPVYLGLLGPKKRADKILGDLARAGLCVTDAMRACFHAPVGLDLGGDGPEAVALSVLAEMQAVLARRDAQPLHKRTGPIHH